LRARYYNPTDGRFISRDTWSGDVNNPHSLNRWMYVEGNPINYIDPTGHYGAFGSVNGHYIATYKAAMSLPVINYVAQLLGRTADSLSAEIAGSSRDADFTFDYAYFTPWDDNAKHHFTDLPTARLWVENAIQLRSIEGFGVSLHLLQDWYAHANEGYYAEHSEHSSKSYFRGYLRDDFFNGGHYSCNQIDCRFIESPFRAYPKEEVENILRIINPDLDFMSLSNDDLIDLFLRSDVPTPNLENLRDYFGFDTDLYIESSRRDRQMYETTRQYVDKFLIHYLLSPCR